MISLCIFSKLSIIYQTQYKYILFSIQNKISYFRDLPYTANVTATNTRNNFSIFALAVAIAIECDAAVFPDAKADGSCSH